MCVAAIQIKISLEKLPSGGFDEGNKVYSQHVQGYHGVRDYCGRNGASGLWWRVEVVPPPSLFTWAVVGSTEVTPP
jgi:hypothetical protein